MTGTLERLKGISNEVIDIWNRNPNLSKRALKWADMLIDSKKYMKKTRTKFHQWKPLRVYTSVSKVKKSGSVKYSIRFHGQEVGEMIVKGNEGYLAITEERNLLNIKYFGFNELESEDEKDKHYPWDGKVAKKFRAHFKQLESDKKKHPHNFHSPEHKVESFFIEQMEMRSSKKFQGQFTGIQPIKIAGCPFQMPMPISASGGLEGLKDQKKNPRDGNIDILTRRRGNDNRVRLSVWELKRPNTLDKALEQVCIYSVTLAQIFGSACGDKWYMDLFDFKSKVPEKLEIEAIVAVTEDKFKHLIDNSKIDEPLIVENTAINFYAACYDDKSFMIKDFQPL